MYGEAVHMGKAKITQLYRVEGRMYCVEYRNTGSFQIPEPKEFWTEQDAIDWCNMQGFEIVSSPSVEWEE